MPRSASVIRSYIKNIREVIVEKKIKWAILGLIVLLAMSFFVIFSVQSSKIALLRKYNEDKERLTKESEEFSKKLATALTDSKELQSRLGSIQMELERLSTEKIELQNQYELLNKEKTELLDKVKKRALVKPEPAVEEPPELKPPTPISEDAYWAEILKTKANLELQVKDLNQRLKDLEISNQQLQNEKTSWELKVSELNQEKDELERKLQYNEKLLDSISTQMVHERNKIYQLQKDMVAVKQENESLRSEVKRLDKQRLAFAEKLSDLLKERESLITRVDKAELTLNEKVSQMERMHHEFEALLKKVTSEAQASGIKPTEGAVELPPIVVSSSPAAEEGYSLKLEGKILTVDEEHSFIVIDLGKADGAIEDMVFEVFRGDELLGKVKIIQLREEIAACDIIQTITSFKIGDIVRY